MAAYAKHRVHEQRGATVGTDTTDRDRWTFNRTDALDIITVLHYTGHKKEVQGVLKEEKPFPPTEPLLQSSQCLSRKI